MIDTVVISKMQYYTFLRQAGFTKDYSLKSAGIENNQVKSYQRVFKRHLKRLKSSKDFTILTDPQPSPQISFSEHIAAILHKSQPAKRIINQLDISNMIETPRPSL